MRDVLRDGRRMDGWLDWGCIEDGCMDVLKMDGWMGGWTDRWTDGRMD